MRRISHDPACSQLQHCCLLRKADVDREPAARDARRRQAAPPKWEATTREIYKTAIEIATVARAPQGARSSPILAAKLKRGWLAPTATFTSYPTPRSTTATQTAALIARWRVARMPTPKPILIMAHMDVVEAHPQRLDHTTRSSCVEKDGYFYGRGTERQKKGGLVPTMVALMKLRAEGFQPDRDIILLYTGDEETQGKGAELGATEWRKWTEAEFCSECGRRRRRLRRATASRSVSASQTSEKTFQSYYFTRAQSAVVTVHGRGPTMRSTSSRTRSRRFSTTASPRC